ncbi:hypothetical protein [Archangium primigenium]|uniref:hypothetical protein n=1 Tax=[Archangium] primigenium TaxID=2792470 RepID=UPI00195A4283|nr:hypothetical protein [Archangium primigenium]MBM7115033.1 hypothetical protein [Archangium primigenium]
METSSAIPPKRLWAVRLAVLVAGLGSIATSMAPPPISAQTTFDGKPFLIRSEAPKATRTFRLELLQEDTPHRMEVGLDGQLEVHWRQDDPSVQSASTLVRARVYVAGDDGYGSPWSESMPLLATRPGEAARPTTLSLYTHPSVCESSSTCEWRGTLEVELIPNGAPGVAEVAWKLTSRATEITNEGKDEPLEGIELRITEE